MLPAQDYNISAWAVAMNVSVRPSAAPSGTFSLAAQTSLVEGFLSSRNILTGDRYDDVTPRYDADLNAPAAISLQQVCGLCGGRWEGGRASTPRMNEPAHLTSPRP